MRDPKQRFATRVEAYIKYRPGYPQAVLTMLALECRLVPESIIADVGCGTGKLAELFLRNGNTVYGVEPNAQMRAAGEQLFRGYSNFRSVAGSAEVTTLADASVDMVTAAQAFHWFDCGATRQEFARILKPHGWVALIWNRRRLTGKQFLEAYEGLLRQYGTDYAEVSDVAEKAERVRAFFAPRSPRRQTFRNRQEFDAEGIRGRLLSSSYTPEAGHTNYQPMLEELSRIFHTYAENGKVVLEYDVEVLYEQL